MDYYFDDREQYCQLTKGWVDFDEYLEHFVIIFNFSCNFYFYSYLNSSLMLAIWASFYNCRDRIDERILIIASGAIMKISYPCSFYTRLDSLNSH
jgi:hypothetical protein